MTSGERWTEAGRERRHAEQARRDERWYQAVLMTCGWPGQIAHPRLLTHQYFRTAGCLEGCGFADLGQVYQPRLRADYDARLSRLQAAQRRSAPGGEATPGGLR